VDRGRLALIAPAGAWWLLFLVCPLLLVVVYTTFTRGEFGGVLYELTASNYERAFQTLYLDAFVYSVRIAATATLLALLLGYPLAYFIATRSPRWRTRLLILVILPFWTSLLLRTYAWAQILNSQGIANSALQSLGVTSHPIDLLYNDFAVTIGLLSAYLPLMVLPLYAAIERLRPELREASRDLGASPLRAFLTVTVPLTRTAAVAGCVFVFVPSLGNFLVPDLLGGGKKLMIGNVIQQQFFQAGDWPFGATLGLGLILVTLLALGLLVRRGAKEVSA
jgi:spermidine/putrescine transport system permease protein